MQKENLEILLEDIRSKFDLVLEGHAALDRKIDDRFNAVSEKLDLNSFKIDVLSKKVDDLETKVDGVAADLAAHRTDTEAHHGVYRVKEG